MKQAIIYSLKVWLTTAILGMRLTTLIKIVTDNDPRIYKAQDIFSSAIYDIPLGIAACLPSFLLFSFAVRYFSTLAVSTRYEKIWLTFTSIPLCLLPFALLFWHQLTHINYLPDMLPMLIAYTVLTIGGIWLYRVKSVNDTNTVTL